jgi:hypothetical protein
MGNGWWDQSFDGMIFLPFPCDGHFSSSIFIWLIRWIPNFTCYSFGLWWVQKEGLHMWSKYSLSWVQIWEWCLHLAIGHFMMCTWQLGGQKWAILAWTMMFLINLDIHVMSSHACHHQPTITHSMLPKCRLYVNRFISKNGQRKKKLGYEKCYECKMSIFPL